MGNPHSSKMRFMRFLLISLFFFSLGTIHAQKLSSEKDKLLKQLPRIIENESFSHFVKHDFSKFIQDSKLNSQEYNRFIETCNSMFKRFNSSIAGCLTIVSFNLLTLAL